MGFFYYSKKAILEIDTFSNINFQSPLNIQ